MNLESNVTGASSFQVQGRPACLVPGLVVTLTMTASQTCGGVQVDGDLRVTAEDSTGSLCTSGGGACPSVLPGHCASPQDSPARPPLPRGLTDPEWMEHRRPGPVDVPNSKSTGWCHFTLGCVPHARLLSTTARAFGRRLTEPTSRERRSPGQLCSVSSVHTDTSRTPPALRHKVRLQDTLQMTPERPNVCRHQNDLSNAGHPREVSGGTRAQSVHAAEEALRVRPLKTRTLHAEHACRLLYMSQLGVRSAEHQREPLEPRFTLSSHEVRACRVPTRLLCPGAGQ